MGYEQISADEFSQAEGVGDWRAVGEHAYAVFRTGSFATGLELVNAIGELAEAANHHPDLKLGYPSLAVHLTTHDTGSLTTADLDLAQRISAAARDLGVAGDPEAVQAWE